LIGYIEEVWQYPDKTNGREFLSQVSSIQESKASRELPSGKEASISLWPTIIQYWDSVNLEPDHRENSLGINLMRT